MSELTSQLTQEGEKHKGTLLGNLLRWAALHIAEQDEALAEVRADYEAEENERIRLERVVFDTREQLSAIVEAMQQPEGIQLARDHAPHINIMAHHGVAPYATKSGKPKSAT